MLLHVAYFTDDYTQQLYIIIRLNNNIDDENDNDPANLMDIITILCLIYFDF